MFEGLRKPMDLIVIVVTLLTYGCPVQAIVHAFGLDERTVADWRDRAGAHCQNVHQGIVEQGQLDLMHVQADEIRVKGCKMIVWMGLAMMVSTRLWLGGVVQFSRDRSLADRLLVQVRRSAQVLRPLLVLTDGWSAYPNSIRRAFRKTGQAEPRSWASPFADLAAVAHWHGDQADPAKAGGRDHAQDDPWGESPGGETASALPWWQRPEHGFHRALEWNVPGTVGQLDAEIPPRRSSDICPGDRHVSDRMQLQFLFSAS